MSIKIGIYSSTKVVSARIAIALTELNKTPPSDLLTVRKREQNACDDLTNFINQIDDKVELGYDGLYDSLDNREYLHIAAQDLIYFFECEYEEYDLTFEGKTGLSSQEVYHILKMMDFILRASEDESEIVLKRHKNRISIDVETKAHAAFKQVCKDEAFGLVLDAASPLYVGTDVININDMVSFKLNDL